MRRIIALAVLAALSVSLALGCSSPPEPAVREVTRVVTATANPTNTPLPATPTWEQWIKQELINNECENPKFVLTYENETTIPPYSADLVCVDYDSLTASIAPTPQLPPLPTPTWNQWLRQEETRHTCPNPGQRTSGSA